MKRFSLWALSLTILMVGCYRYDVRPISYFSEDHNPATYAGNGFIVETKRGSEYRFRYAVLGTDPTTKKPVIYINGVGRTQSSDVWQSVSGYIFLEDIALLQEISVDPAQTAFGIFLGEAAIGGLLAAIFLSAANT